MKIFVKSIGFSALLLFLLLACKKNENRASDTAKTNIENPVVEEPLIITVEDYKKLHDLENPEVKKYFTTFYESLKMLDVENPTIEEQIKLFYETIKVLDEEYYFNLFEFDYKPSDELKIIFHKIFLKDEIWQDIIANLHPKASQQPDRFLYTSRTIKLKGISIVTIDDNECICEVKAEALHWFYSDRSIDFIKYMYFKYYDDICITQEDLEYFRQKTEKEYEEIGQGKPWGNTIKTEENHRFHLVKKDGIYKIKDFVFNITSFTEN